MASCSCAMARDSSAFAIDELAGLILDFPIAQRLRRSGKERQLGWQFLALLDQAQDHLGQVFEVNESLSVTDIAREDMAKQGLFVNSRKLLREERVVSA